MTPMGTNYGEQNGEMSFLHINYYEQRAKGGTGLIIVENASVDSPQGSNGTTQLRIDHDNYLPRLFKFCENIHRYGTARSSGEAGRKYVYLSGRRTAEIIRCTCKTDETAVR